MPYNSVVDMRQSCNSITEIVTNLCNLVLLACPPGELDVPLLVRCCLSPRIPIMSERTGLIFAKFSSFVGMWVGTIDLTLFCVIRRRRRQLTASFFALAYLYVRNGDGCVFTRDSIYAIARICHGNSVCLSVCPSVCPSHGWISQKRLKLGSRNFYLTVAPSL